MTATVTPRSRPVGLGRVLISLAAVATGVGPYRYDWNETHIHNPTWPPHAKFHNAQTMSMGAALALVTLVQLWKRGDTAPRTSLNAAATATGLYWVTQLSAGLYPGAAGLDPPGHDDWGRSQLRFSLPILALVAVGHGLERRRLAAR